MWTGRGYGGKSESQDAGLNREINSTFECPEKIVSIVLSAISIPYTVIIERSITSIQIAFLPPFLFL